MGSDGVAKEKVIPLAKEAKKGTDTARQRLADEEASERDRELTTRKRNRDLNRLWARQEVQIVNAATKSELFIATKKVVGASDLIGLEFEVIEHGDLSSRRVDPVVDGELLEKLERAIQQFLNSVGTQALHHWVYLDDFDADTHEVVRNFIDSSDSRESEDGTLKNFFRRKNGKFLRMHYAALDRIFSSLQMVANEVRRHLDLVGISSLRGAESAKASVVEPGAPYRYGISDKPDSILAPECKGNWFQISWAHVESPKAKSTQVLLSAVGMRWLSSHEGQAASSHISTAIEAATNAGLNNCTLTFGGPHFLVSEESNVVVPSQDYVGELLRLLGYQVSTSDNRCEPLTTHVSWDK
jgi:hypothetical protein